MAKKKRAKIECRVCGKSCVNYGYNLCSPCYKKFIKGLLEHPDGFEPHSRRQKAASADTMIVAEPVHAPDSDLALIDSGNPFALPFGAELYPAGADNPYDYLLQERIYEDVDQRRAEFVEELLRAA